MEAVRYRRIAFAFNLLATLCLSQLCLSQQNVQAANARTQNFLVHARTQALARTVADQAEKFRDDLAIYWLGKPLPPWRTPCPIEVVSGSHLAAQGVTTYNRSPVGNFQMKVIGTPERILDSVLPHEVTHTVLATHFGRPLPRWADEGICTTVEHTAEKQKHEAKLREFLRTSRGIAMNELLLLTEYPSDMLPMYAQGYSVCRFLIEQSGPKQFIDFLTDYMKRPSWTANVRKHYGYETLAKLQKNWLAWVASGSGSVETFVSARNRAGNAVASLPSRPGTRSSTTPNNPSPRSLNAANSLAATESGSWYRRRRTETASGKTAAETVANRGPQTTPTGADNSTPTPTSIAPPSVSQSGRYSVSQPQPEQRFGQAAPLTGTSINRTAERSDLSVSTPQRRFYR